MERNAAIIALLTLILIVVALPLGTVGAEAPPLTFDTLSKQSDFSDSQDGTIRMQILSSKPTFPVTGVSLADQTMLETVDYDKYLVVVAFFGYGAMLQEGITNVWEFRDVIWIRSLYSTASEDATVKYYPYQIIKLEKTQMQRFGNITFRLLSGYDQKSETVQNVPAPAVFTPN
jgi:hypothetical protein